LQQQPFWLLQPIVDCISLSAMYRILIDKNSLQQPIFSFSIDNVIFLKDYFRISFFFNEALIFFTLS